MQHSSASHCTSQKSNKRLIRQMPRSLLNNISIKCHRSIYETTIKLSHSISPLPVNEIIAHLKTKPLAIHKWVSALHAFSVYPIPTAHRCTQITCTLVCRCTIQFTIWWWWWWRWDVVVVRVRMTVYSHSLLLFMSLCYFSWSIKTNIFSNEHKID